MLILKAGFVCDVESENRGASRLSDGILPAVCTLKITHAETVGIVAFAFVCSHIYRFICLLASLDWQRERISLGGVSHYLYLSNYKKQG